MNSKQREQLKRECPLLYRNGFPGGTGSGWFQIIYDLSVALEKEMLSWSLLGMLQSDLSRMEYPYPVQIKEKFGSLCFYMSHNYGRVNKLIREAEDKSYDTCEDCGEPGERRGGGWVRTLCESCDRVHEQERIERLKGL